VTLNNQVWGVGNMAANIRIFGGNGQTQAYTSANLDARARIPATFADGTSNTITFATRYAQCASGGSAWAGGSTTAGGAFLTTGGFFGSDILDVPVTGDFSGIPFLVAPSQPPGVAPACDPKYAHSFGSGGIQVALGDGTVRSVAPSISPITWGRAVHPSDGKILPDDW
jgi:hypothetical protein